MNNFIEITPVEALYRNVIINLDNVTSVVQYTPRQKEEYWVYLIGDEMYQISKEQYEAIRAKLIDKGELNKEEIK